MSIFKNLVAPLPPYTMAELALDPIVRDHNKKWHFHLSFLTNWNDDHGTLVYHTNRVDSLARKSQKINEILKGMASCLLK